MKKKILLFLSFIVLLVCTLAISIGASTVYRDANGNELFRYEMDENSVITTYEGAFPKTDSEGNALTWYVTATSTEGESTVKTVASVLTADEAYFSITDGKYTYATSTVTQYNVVSVNYPSDAGITTLSLANDGFRKSNTYTYSPNVTEILFVYLPTTLTSLPSRLGQGSKMLVCEIPNEIPVEYISHVFFHDARCIREINIPSSATEIGGQSQQNGAAFYNAVSLERVTFGSNENLEKIGTMAFHKTNLKYITIPDSVVSIGEHAFSYTSLVDSPFTEESRCTTLGGRAFSDINGTMKSFIVPSSLTSVTILGDNDYGPLSNSSVELVTYGTYEKITALPRCFFGRATIGEIVLPEGPTEIPERYFICAKIKDVQFSDTIETARERVFQSANVEVIRFGVSFKHFTNTYTDNLSFMHSMNDLKKVYLPATFYSKAPETEYQVSYAFNCNTNNIKFFYTGTAEQLAVSMENFKNATKLATDHNQKFTDAVHISWADYQASPDAYASGNYIIYDYNMCDAFYEGKHNISTVITYPTFDTFGTKVTGCTKAGCNNKTTTDAQPLVGCIGYSSPENGDGGITVGFRVNHDAISEYESIMSVEIKHGIFVVLKEQLGENSIVNEDDSFASGVIGADLTESKFALVNLKIAGFETDKQKAAKFAMGAYIIASNEETKQISYIQHATPAEGEKYFFTSYNEAMPTKED